MSPLTTAMYVLPVMCDACFGLQTYQPLPIDIALGDGADNMKHDEQNKLLYVAYGSGSIAVIRTDRGKREPDASQNLASHPEGFHYSRDRKLIYCNVPGKLAVVKIQNTVAGLLARAHSTDAHTHVQT